MSPTQKSIHHLSWTTKRITHVVYIIVWGLWVQHKMISYLKCNLWLRVFLRADVWLLDRVRHVFLFYSNPFDNNISSINWFLFEKIQTKRGLEQNRNEKKSSTVRRQKTILWRRADFLTTHSPLDGTSIEFKKWSVTFIFLLLRY
jgi:hypothetical protein